MTTKGKEAWLTGFVLMLGLLFAVGLGIYSFVNNTTPLHSNPTSVGSVIGTAPSPEWAGAVEQGRSLARAIVVEQNLPGLSVAVGAAGEILWAEGFGWADIEKRVAVTPAMRFRIGHASKALTSAAVGLLLETDRLRLGDEIQTYVPGFPKKEWPVTLRQLMGHVGGIRHYDSEADYMLSAHCERADEGLRQFEDDPLLFEPATQYKYSTFGWILVSAAVEAAAREPFFAFMRTKIFQPLGMTDTTYDGASDSTPNRVTFYYPRLSGDPQTGVELATTVDYSCFSGAGGFLSTPSDLVRFGAAISNGTFLRPGTIKTLQTPQLLASGDETEYGLGWTLETITLAGEPARLASHASRTLLGGSTTFMSIPERGIVVAVTSNVSFATTRTLALNIAEAFALPKSDKQKKVKSGN